MNVLLTGATGFIGAQVLERLLAGGDVVQVLVQPETLSQPQRVKHLYQRNNVEVITGRLADVQVLAEATQRAEVVYHLAARLPGPDIRPRDLYWTNVQGTENLLRASVKGKVRRFVFASSAVVYNMRQGQITENTPLQPHGVYGQTKMSAEKLVRQYHCRYGLEHVILRLSPVYGPRGQYFEWLLSRILNHPLMFLVHGQRRIANWVHRSDAGDAIVLAGLRPEASGNTFNIAGNETITLHELVKMVHDIAGTSSYVRRLGARSTTHNSSLRYDIHKAKDLLGFAPKINFKDGLAEMITALDQNSLTTHRTAALLGRSRWTGT